ncbi:hypothetical protein [uncultured Rhodoblastus sp.]|uniref:hypothetical protein n=1 Tax=uncultured Rhodoblastus sp. TaxID=543037 RepID=UPI0025D54047|nr:hypothetical protein [uncultured Rhodoblastus sp.]
MNSIEKAPETAADRLARALFDTVLVPAAEARRAEHRAEFFPLAPDPAAASYFENLDRGARGETDFPGGGEVEGLINALADYWRAQGEAGLVALAPGLKSLARALGEEGAEGDGSVDPYCYTMF